MQRSVKIIAGDDITNGLMESQINRQTSGDFSKPTIIDALLYPEHIAAMAKISNREKILQEGLKVVDEVGFSSASVRTIVGAAGVPLGSFTNNFASKEAFGLEIVELYFANSQSVVLDTLRNDDKPPLARLREYIARSRSRESCGGPLGGLLGNFIAEPGGAGDAIRQRVNEIVAGLTDSVAYCLEAAVAAGELAPDLDCLEVAGFIVSSHQGAVLLSKSQRSPEPIERLETVLFSTVLRPLR
jgi:TetR/AcrR family transcriptional regulator, transcriptional repressor for nem operon